jgi:hypothetical protein
MVKIKKRRQDISDELNKIKSQKCCQKCGENRYYVLDFHHIDPKQKDFGLNDKSKNINTIFKEIEKCVILCSNCHREFHHLERSNKLTIQKYLTL